MAEAGPDELIPVTIILADQLTGSRLTGLAQGIEDRHQRRRVLVAALKSHAQASQVRLLNALEDGRLAGKAANIRPLWIGNIVAAELTSELILQVAGRTGVSRINWAPPVDVFLERPGIPADNFSLDHGSDPFLEDPEIAAVECGTDLMGAPLVWNDLGNTGDGAVIAVIDSGVCWYHPDIANQIWVNPGEDLDSDGVVMDNDDMNGVDDDGNGYVDDLIGFDIENGDNDPNDDNSHGSHCAGSIAGDGTGGTESGLAPDARVMPLRVGLTFSDEPDVWEAMQYAADNGADSISMSLGWPHSQNPDRATWRQNCENTIDLGTAMVIAAGNEGQGAEPDNIRTPGDVPRIISVAAVDCSDNIASFSSRGPVTWQDVAPFNDYPYPPGLVKPDVAGPGVNTVSHNVCSGYSTKSGTSMATPHVAGAVALMVSANPGLTHDDIKQILEDTAIDLGDPGKDNVYGSGRVDAYEAVLASQTSNGRMSIKEQEVRCDGGVFNLIVSDQDLQGAGSLAVDVHSGTEPTPETVTLTETSGSSGVFKGTILTAEGAPAFDGIIQVVNGDLVTATYIDADDGEGGINVPKTDTGTTDCGSPSISGVTATDFTTSSAIVRWTTDEPSNSRVTYGETTPPAQGASGGGLTTQHAVNLNGLSECTVYYFEVASADAYGNDATDDNGGGYYYFETYGNFGQGPQPCHAGQITLDRPVLACDGSLDVQLVDLDLNLDAGAVDTVTVWLTSTTEPEPDQLVLTETGVNSSTFTGSFTVQGGAPIPGDGVIQTSPGDTITASYLDEDNGTGSGATSYATAYADCLGAEAVSIEVVGVTDESARIRVVTSEQTTVVVDWGITAGLGSQVSSSGLATSHELQIGPFLECGRFHFQVSTTDTYGNGSFFDAGGAPFAANVFEIAGALYKDGFESDLGWTLDDEWELGVPEGLGSGSGDPAAAFAGSGVLGHDLTGQGDYPGDYEPGGFAETYATSPVIDASGLTSVDLKLRRWLNSGGGGIATLEVKDAGNNWISIFTTDSFGEHSESAWSINGYNVTAQAAGNPNFQVRFKQAHGLSLNANRAGWNVDRLVVRDGLLPDFGACDGCGGGPTFAGAVAATDNDPCGAGGVTVSWNQAPAWGTGSGGTYTVYRDTVPGFNPGPSNQVATGIAGLNYNDATAPDGQTLYYVVRAETGESCSTGPNNGGQMDANTVQVQVNTTATRPVPGAVAPIQVDLVNHAHVRLSWTAAPDVATYRIYHSTGPDPATFSLLNETTEPFYEHINQAGNGNNWHYLVRAANSCGQESP